MNVFHRFASVRKTLHYEGIILKPEGPVTNDQWIELGSTMSNFQGKIDQVLCTPEFREMYCTNNMIDIKRLEAQCGRAMNPLFRPALSAIAEAYWRHIMDRPNRLQEIAASEAAFYLAYAIQFLAINGNKPLDTAAYGNHVAFGLYNLEQAMQGAPVGE